MAMGSLLLSCVSHVATLVMIRHLSLTAQTTVAMGAERATSRTGADSRVQLCLLDRNR